MRKIIAILAILGLALPAMAQELPGLDDPAFRAAWGQLLRADDPAALHDLHDLATSGNPAALVALPLALRWLPPQPDRAALRRIGQDLVQDLGRAAWKPAALWADGDMSPDLADQLGRAVWLYDLGEARKGDALLGGWFNHMPMAAPLPDGFPRQEASPLLTALILVEHLTRGDRKALAPLQDLLDRDLIEGWMALAEVNRYPVTAGPPIQAGLRLNANSAQRLADGRAALRLMWNEEPRPPLPDPLLDMAVRDLLPRPEFAPIRAFCAASCADSAPSCERAFLMLLGAPHHSTTQSTPLQSLMPEAAFFATPRGVQVLFAAAMKHRLGLDLADDPSAKAAADPALTAARSLDACLADAALQALRPFPAAP